MYEKKLHMLFVLDYSIISTVSENNGIIKELTLYSLSSSSFLLSWRVCKYSKQNNIQRKIFNSNDI